MRKCGVCQSQVDYTFNMFKEHIGTPPVLLSKVLIKCTRGTKRKYIRGGICQNCIDDLLIYYDALQTAKCMRQKILEHIEKETIDDLTPIKSECEEFLVEPQDTATGCDTEEALYEVIQQSPATKESFEAINEDYMISVVDDDDDDDDVDDDEQDKSTEFDTEDEGDEIGHTCNECGERFADYRSCKLHKAKLHPKSYVCQHCGKILSTATGLKKHIRLHNPEKPLSCCVCGKRYHFEVDLKNHEAWHTGERPYECAECGKRFANFSSLSCHKISHKPLPENIACDVCGKKFRKPSRLKSHQLSHATVKNYACPYCKYCTANKISLNWHLKNNKKCSALHLMDPVM